jgi:hypothetical protein
MLLTAVAQLEGHKQNGKLVGKLFLQIRLLLVHRQPPYQCLF